VLFDAVTIDVVEVAVMEIVDMVSMTNCHVTTALAMHMAMMIFMLGAA
jgi:hypothetical protein